MSFFDVAKALHEARWVFAKTMPQNPHFYTLRKQWRSKVPFEAVVAYIREHGYPYKFGGKVYTQLDINGFYYWTMGAPLAETILINRKDCPVWPAYYDKIADRYDDLFTGDQYKAEEADVARMLKEYEGPFLDIGCGTGLLLDLIDPAAGYFGIDPSAKMLERLKKVHPEAEVAPWMLEQLYTPKPYGTAVSLFGTPSYITPDALQRIPLMARRWFLMFYAPDYEPVTHTKTGLRPPILSQATDVPGERWEFGDYVIVEGRA